MLGEFRAFITRGSVLDLAIAVIIGAAFASIVTSLTEDVIMPVIGALTGGLDFSNYFARLGPLTAGYTGPQTYVELKKAGVPLFGYGAFLTAVVRFLILALVIFWLIRFANRLFRLGVGGPAAIPDDILVLREIRDELRARPRLP